MPFRSQKNTSIICFFCENVFARTSDDRTRDYGPKDSIELLHGDGGYETTYIPACTLCRDEYKHLLNKEEIPDDGALLANPREIASFGETHGLDKRRLMHETDSYVTDRKATLKEKALTPPPVDPKKARLALKERVITAYSSKGRCRCCKTTDVDVLTVDARRPTAWAPWAVPTDKFLRGIERQGYPPGYIVLCYNCRISRHTHEGLCKASHPRGKKRGKGMEDQTNEQ